MYLLANPKFAVQKVEFVEKGAIKTAKYSDNDEADQLEVVPGLVVLTVEHHQMLRSERIDRTQHKSGGQRA